MSGPKANGGGVALTDRTDAHHEADVAGIEPGLVGMHDHARIAQGSTLDGVFTRKGGAEEQAAGRRQPAFRTETIRELVGVLQERVGQSMMT